MACFKLLQLPGFSKKMICLNFFFFKKFCVFGLIFIEK